MNELYLNLSKTKMKPMTNKEHNQTIMLEAIQLKSVTRDKACMALVCRIIKRLGMGSYPTKENKSKIVMAIDLIREVASVNPPAATEILNYCFGITDNNKVSIADTGDDDNNNGEA